MKSWKQLVEEISASQSPEEMGKIIGGVIIERDRVIEAVKTVIDSIPARVSGSDYTLVSTQSLLELENLIGAL